MGEKLGLPQFGCVFSCFSQFWPIGHTNDVGTNHITCQESSMKTEKNMLVMLKVTLVGGFNPPEKY